ncbi:MAG TPA: dTDP-4-dehydrorhamnose 3,5-epimerase [Azospirillaceae bacterium]|nr:dTDP-4-dehydrorhamnose 3,5-epimerase [Azospirillaceae bacterium]
MKFTPLAIPGAWQLDVDRHEDERGFFARSWCAEEFAAHGLNAGFIQSSVSYNRRRGTLRGMHLQRDPHGEEKLVRCTAGAMYDVLLDLRPDSPAYLRWAAVELTADNRRSVYIPKGVAHGFQTLSDDSEVLYCMTVTFHPAASMGVRWNDPAFAIDWPVAEITISDRDAAYPDYRRE